MKKKGKKITKLHGKEYPKGTHMCATHVEHAEWGQGTPIHSQHAAPDENGQIAWYDVMFEHGIEKHVPIADMNVLAESSHENHDHHDHDGEDLAEKTMDPTKHVRLNKDTGMYCVYNKDGKKVKEFKKKKDADQYATKNHKELMEGMKFGFKMAGIKRRLTRAQKDEIKRKLKKGDVRGAREVEAEMIRANRAGSNYDPTDVQSSYQPDGESLIAEYLSTYFGADLTESIDSLTEEDIQAAIEDINLLTAVVNESMERRFNRAKLGTLGYYFNQNMQRGMDPQEAYRKAQEAASRFTSDTGQRRVASVKQFRGIKAGEEAKAAYMDDIRKRGGSMIPGMTEALRMPGSRMTTKVMTGKGASVGGERPPARVEYVGRMTGEVVGKEKMSRSSLASILNRFRKKTKGTSIKEGAPMDKYMYKPKKTGIEDKLTPAQARDAARRLKPTRATVAKVKLPSTEAERSRYAKQYRAKKGGNPGNTKQRRMRDLKLQLSHTEHDGSEIREGSRGFKRTERVLAAKEKSAIKSGMNPTTMSAKPEGEFAQRGRAFQLRQTDANIGKPDAGGTRRDPLRPHGSARIGTVSRVYTSKQTPSDVARSRTTDPSKKAAIDRTDKGIRGLSDKVTQYKPEVVSSNIAAERSMRARNAPTMGNKMRRIASRLSKLRFMG